MSKTKNALDELINALKILPNLGPKSARRISYQLLQHNREGMKRLILALENALKYINNCALCNTLCEEELCNICSDDNRNRKQLMIVQMPIDVNIFESSNCHTGMYFVLMGQVNPIQDKNIKNSIAIEKLFNRLQNDDLIEEIIIATSFTVEGDTTAYIIKDILKDTRYKVYRLARGIPFNGELEYTDLATISQSFFDRKLM